MAKISPWNNQAIKSDRKNIIRVSYISMLFLSMFRS